MIKKLLLTCALLVSMSCNVNAKTLIGVPMYKEMGTFKLTAYCPCEECSSGFGKRTCTGKTAKSNHTIAVDPSVISYGSRVMIGRRMYKAEDCGSGVEGDHIDIFFDAHTEVDAFGVKYGDVKVFR